VNVTYDCHIRADKALMKDRLMFRAIKGHFTKIQNFTPQQTLCLRGWFHNCVVNFISNFYFRAIMGFAIFVLILGNAVGA
jgi:hypothetical protein